MNSCYEYQDYYGNCYSAWDSWIRWVVLAVIIALFLLLFIGCSCLSARRRHRAGLQPYYGTGWTQRQWPYYDSQPYYPQPAPPYATRANPPPYQQNGIELDSPANSYQRQRDDVYEPPIGPPPGKKGRSAVIR